MTDDEFRDIDRIEKKEDDRVPVVFGRFNYLPVGQDLFNVLFITELGVSAVIAMHIPEYAITKELVDDLNSALFHARRSLSTHYELGVIPKPWPVPRLDDVARREDRDGDNQ